MSTRPELSILAINGSMREGNTSDILRHVGTVAATRGVRVDVVDLRELRLSPCGACGNCNDRPEPCAVSDDVAAVVAKMVAAGGIILASPVYGFGTASLMQTFIERAGVGYLRFERPLTNKVAGVIAVARRYSPSAVWAQLTVNAMLNRMIMVGSGFPAIVSALYKGQAMEDTEGLTNVERMVSRMVDMMELLAEHREMTGAGLRGAAVRNERVGLPLNEMATR